jgi:hypothetical protein
VRAAAPVAAQARPPRLVTVSLPPMEPSDARYPAVAAGAGHYESFYLKCGDAASRQALWLRYTVHKRPGEAVRRRRAARREGHTRPGAARR